ncbi:unnamed protein product [Closterium sp. NIES-64]|nr:unnamed protein product [Closterium sp. NIES-64]
MYGSTDGFSDVEGSSEKSSGGMRVGIETQIDPCGGIGLSPGNDNCFGSCKRRTKSGHCVKELFKLYDDAYKPLLPARVDLLIRSYVSDTPLWPARVDLLIRSYVSDTFFLLEMLFDSIEQMWPRGIGDVILVLDEDNQIVEDIVPTWIKQWSYLWADNYTTAPYIAIIDDDVIFNLKPTFPLPTSLHPPLPHFPRLSPHNLLSNLLSNLPDSQLALMVRLPFVIPNPASSLVLPPLTSLLSGDPRATLSISRTASHPFIFLSPVVVPPTHLSPLQVTPGLLFNLTDGKPYVIGSRQKQMNHWVPSTHYFVGKPYYFANFMVQLPFVFPRDVLPKFRDHVTRIRDGKFASFDAAFLNFARHGPKFERTQIAHTTLGNFMWAFTQDEACTCHTLFIMPPSPSPLSIIPTSALGARVDQPRAHPTRGRAHVLLYSAHPPPSSPPSSPNSQVHWALEWTNHVPIPRVGVHMSYSQPFRTATNNSDNAPRVVKIYVALAGYYAHEALCHAFPKGALDRCGDVLKYEQRQIWQYVMDWYDWPAIKHKRRNATFVYDLYKRELACMYGKVVDARTNEWTDHIIGRRRELVNEMTRDCATPHSI